MYQKRQNTNKGIAEWEKELKFNEIAKRSEIRRMNKWKNKKAQKNNMKKNENKN